MEAPQKAQTGTDEQRRRRKPSTGYPVIDLGEVAVVLGKASQHGWEHTVAEFAGYLGHSTVNSGAFRAKLAALRDYGVISGRGDALEITAIGRKIAIPETPVDRMLALQEAFANTIFGPLYEESVKGSPISIESIGRRAVSRLGVAPASQGAFGEVFARSVVTAGVAESSGDGRITLYTKAQAGSATSDVTTPPSGGATTADPSIQSASLTSKTPSKPVVDQRWPIDGEGEVALIIAIDRPLTASDFAAIGAVVGEIERLVSGLKRGNDGA
jgi:hypothetical protein